MKIRAPEFKHEGKIPSKYTCDGKEVSPELFFEDIPQNTQSLVLIMDDPDVPKSLRQDGMWDHWVVFNISPRCTHVKEGVKIDGTYGKNTSGSNCYQGPCPPDREHRYFFKLYALDCKLSLISGASKKEVEDAMEEHILDQATLMGRYTKVH